MNRVLGGVFDAGFAALGTFVIGVYATLHLPSTELALYSLLFTGWILSSLVPQQLVLTPSRLAMAALSPPASPPIRQNLRATGPAFAIAVIITVLAGAPLLAENSWQVFAMLAGTAALLAVVSPSQDHVRFSLHVVGLHRSAALVSGTNFTVTSGVLLVALVVPGVPAPLVPFGALCIGNAVSALVGVVRLRTVPAVAQPPIAPFGRRVGVLLTEGVVQLSLYIASALVFAILGSGAVAELERARVVASPVFVLLNGFGSFAVPLAARAYNNGPPAALRSIARRYTLAASVAGIGYGVLVLVAGPFLLARTPYDPPLIAARSVGFGFEGGANFFVPLSLITHSGRRWLVVTLVAIGVFLVLLVPALLLFGVYGLPAAQTAASLGRLVAGLVLLRGF